MDLITWTGSSKLTEERDRRRLVETQRLGCKLLVGLESWAMVEVVLTVLVVVLVMVLVTICETNNGEVAAVEDDCAGKT